MITSLLSRQPYAGTGTTGPFGFTFKVFDPATDLKLTKRTTIGTEVPLAYAIDYSVVGIKVGTDPYGGGGTITLSVALAIGETLVIRRSPPVQQNSSLQNQGPYFPKSLEDQLDYLTMLVQAHEDLLARAYKLTETTDVTVTSPSFPSVDPNKALFWKADASGLENRAISTVGGVVLPGQGRITPDLTTYLSNNAVVNPKDFGAKGDVKWDGDPAHDIVGTCSITAGQPTPSSTKVLWNQANIGNHFVFYGAGPTVSNFKTPLVATILAVAVDGKSCTLSVNASNTVTAGLYTGGTAEGSIVGMIARVAWGTDDTAAIQGAIDALAVWDGVSKSNIGGRVLCPPGRYFILGLAMFEAVTTSPAVKAYNGIWIQGSSSASCALETYDPVNALAGIKGAVVSATTDAPSNTPGADWLRGFILSDIEIRIVPHNTNPTNIVTLGAAFDPHVYNFCFYGWSYEGFALGGHGRGGRVHDGVIIGAGMGGPSNPPSTSGLNVFAAEAVIDNVKFSKCGQGMECSSHRGIIRNCGFDGTNVPAFVNPVYGINIGSDLTGIWGLKVLNNNFRSYAVAISVSNILGTLRDIALEGNTIVDGCITFASGQDSNPVTGIDIEIDRIVHSESSISRNTFSYTKFPANACMSIKGDGGTISGVVLESILIKNNAVLSAGMFCSGGTRDTLPANVPGDCPGGGQAFSIAFLVANSFGPPLWTPGRVVAAGQYIVPRNPNGFMYAAQNAGTTGSALNEPAFPTGIDATVVDNGVTWKNFGKECKITLDGNTVSGAPKTIDNPAAFRFDFGLTRRDSVIFISHTHNYPWGYFNGGSSDGIAGFPAETIPANATYSDRNRFTDTVPTGGYYEVGTVLNKSNGTAAKCTRTGRRGVPWAATTAAAYGKRVVGLAVDVGFVFECVIPGVSAGGEPAWNAVLGGTTVDGTITWKAVAVSAIFGAFV